MILKGANYERNSDGDLEVRPAPVKVINVPKPAKKWIAPVASTGTPTYAQRVALLDQILVKLPKVEA